MSFNPCSDRETQAMPAPSSADKSADMQCAPSAMTDPASHARLWLVAVLGLAADLWTKHWAFTRLDPDPFGHGWVAIRGLVAFRRSLNAGALFGIGKGLTPIFIGASIIALGFVLFLFYHSDNKRRSLHIALGLVLAGAMGNLYDRVFMIADVVRFVDNGRRVTLAGKILNPDHSPILVAAWPDGDKPCFRPIGPDSDPQVRQLGVVRDFVKIEPNFKVGKYTIDLWPWVFNVADVLLVVGVCILMLNFWWESRREKALAAQAAAAARADSDSSPV